MNSSYTNTRSSRRRNRKGPIHFAQGLFLETLGFGALIFAMLGLARENWFLALISSPVTENQTVAKDAEREPAKHVPAVGNVFVSQETAFNTSQKTAGTIWDWTAQSTSNTAQSAWQPAPSNEPYLGHNSPWTSRH